MDYVSYNGFRWFFSFRYSHVSYLVIINPSLITAHTVASYDLHRTLRTSCIKAHIVGHYLLPFRVSEHLQICTNLRCEFQKRLLVVSLKIYNFHVNQISNKNDVLIFLEIPLTILGNKYGRNVPFIYILAQSHT